MPLFRVKGVVAPAAPDAGAFSALPPGLVTLKLEARPQGVRANTIASTHQADDDDVVELEFDDGIRLWMRAEDVQQDFGLSPSRGPGGEVIDVPAELPIGGPSRGAGAWAIRALRIFGIDIAGSITDFVSANVEGRLEPGPGLYRCSSSGPARLLEPDGLDSQQPTLVFLHGTASSTDGSFGGLWEGGDSARIRRLLSDYHGQVLAFQHRTLTQSPIENALDLARALSTRLAAGAELHLVSHSRGGLVGELLARGARPGGMAFDEPDLRWFQQEGRERDCHALRELNEVLLRSRLRVTRFVRVACPARGTTLADGRLDRYFSILANVVRAIPALRASPICDAVLTLLAAVLKKRTDPSELPGLEAMMSTSPLVAMLNRPDLQLDADLHVLGGDVEGVGLWGRLKVLASDFYYRDDHDLVVPTPSMLGGARRAQGVRYWIDTGAKVNHFSYFRNEDTASRLLTALEDGARAAADYRALEAAPSRVTAEDYRKRTAAPRPVVIVVPGLMGTELNMGGEAIWPDARALACGGFTRLDIDAEGIAAGALLGSAYRDLVRFFGDTHDVVPFPYDWRRSLLQSAELLREVIDRCLAASAANRQPVCILAHSTGGLVLRAMLGSPAGAATWRRMCEHPGSRAIMLGTPNSGSHAIAGMLLGEDLLVRSLALLEPSRSTAAVIRTLSRMDGVLELLPHGDSGIGDLLQADTWQHATTVAADGLSSFPDESALGRARRVLEAIAHDTIDESRMVYVAGCADRTPCALAFDPAQPAGRRITVVATAEGDGRVPWATGIPDALRSVTYYMDADHGSLAGTPESFPALLDLAMAGTTTKLSRTPPLRRGTGTELARRPVRGPAMFPGDAELADAALGSERRRAPASRAKPRVRVRVVHGDLAHAEHPVLVGHYRDDPIVSAERYLDRQLDGRLTELRRLGLYAGPLETSTVVLNDLAGAPQRHPGAVVVGLGMAGELAPGPLTHSLAHAVTAFGAEACGQSRRGQPRDGEAGSAATPLRLGLSALLVGAGGGGVSTLDSLRAILRAVLRANASYADTDGDRAAADTRGGDEGVAATSAFFVECIDIVELYEDRAVCALHKLLDLGRRTEVRDGFLIEETLVCGPGGRERVPPGDDAEWWQRLRIETTKDDALLFEAVTERARVPSYLQPAQRRLVDTFLRQAVGSTATDLSLCETLFELLAPVELKQYAPDQRRLALVLDDRSAEYPWELLHDRFDRDALPMSVETGMIRQLLTPSCTARPLTAAGDHALVVGDPTAGDESGVFDPLPGAAHEAREVATLLRGRDYDVTDLIEGAADAQSVVSALFARPYRILHLAGHGVFEYAVADETRTGASAEAVGRRVVTGMPLGGGLFLTPGEFAQLRFVPELVFINCCHLGTTRGDARAAGVAYPQLAANVATQLIRMGARAVVAAGWSVCDKAAVTFARTFYDSLFAGNAFGDAVRTAREETYRRHPDVNTWGAYQCYGDPAFSLRPVPGVSVDQTIVAEVELRLKAEQVAAQAAHPEQDRAQLRRRLEELVKVARPAWLASARTAAALGCAYGALGEFAKAVEHYKTAAVAEPAEAAVEAVEQLANLEARWAASLVESHPPLANGASREARRLFTEAERLLHGLVEIGETVERLSMLGSLNKRLALWGGPSRDETRVRAARTQALDAMIDAYGRAYVLACVAGRDNAWYPLLNRVSAQVVRGWMSPRSGKKGTRPRARLVPDPSLAEGLRRLARYAREGAARPGFWEMCLPADQALLSALARGQLAPETRRRVECGYREAARRFGSPRELRSVRDQIAFFASMARVARTGMRGREDLARALEEMRTALDTPS